MDACTNPDVLKVIYFFLIIIDIVKIVIPIGLIVISLIDFSKSVISSDEKVQKKSVSLFVKRLISAILVFAVPWIIEVLMVTIGNTMGEEVNFTDCIENANKIKIQELESNPSKGENTPTQKSMCYVCEAGDTKQYKWSSKKPTDVCMSSKGWEELPNVISGVYCNQLELEENKETNTPKGMCYYCVVTNKFVWSYGGIPSESCPANPWKEKQNLTIEECK